MIMRSSSGGASVTKCDTGKGSMRSIAATTSLEVLLEGKQTGDHLIEQHADAPDVQCARLPHGHALVPVTCEAVVPRIVPGSVSSRVNVCASPPVPLSQAPVSLAMPKSVPSEYRRA